MMSFLCFPVDIVRALLQQTDQVSLTSVALVCKVLVTEVRPYLYHTIILNSTRNRMVRVSLYFISRARMITILQIYDELLHLMVSRDLFAQHVRVLKVVIGRDLDERLCTALTRMTNLRRLEGKDFRVSNIHFYLLHVRGDLRALKWKFNLAEETTLVNYIDTHHPRLRHLELYSSNTSVHHSDDLRASPVVPGSFPCLESLCVDWGFAYAIVHAHGHNLVHLDVDIMEKRIFCPSWFSQSLPALRYLRIRTLGGDLGLDLHARIVASAPNLEYLLIPIYDAKVSDDPNVYTPPS